MSDHDDATNHVGTDQSSFPGGITRGEMASSHFTIVSNLVSRDPNLSYAAKGLFGNLAGHRADFTITEGFLASQSSDGVKAIRRMLQELRAAGYLYRGERFRHPQGTRNADGKDISGSLGSYKWYITDKPDEIAEFLKRYREEYPGSDPQSAGQNRVTKRQPVVTSDDADAEPVDNSTGGSSLAPETADSDDQGKGPEIAGHYSRPKPPGGNGTAREDHGEKTIREKNNSPSPWHRESPHAGETEQGQGETPPGKPNTDELAWRRELDAASSWIVDKLQPKVPTELWTTMSKDDRAAIWHLVAHARLLKVANSTLEERLVDFTNLRYLGPTWRHRLTDIVRTADAEAKQQARLKQGRPACTRCNARAGAGPLERVVSTDPNDPSSREVPCPGCRPHGQESTEAS